MPCITNTLLTDYCLNVQKGDRVYVRTTYLAEKLVQELMREVTKAGGHLITDIQFQGQEEIFFIARPRSISSNTSTRLKSCDSRV